MITITTTTNAAVPLSNPILVSPSTVPDPATFLAAVIKPEVVDWAIEFGPGVPEADQIRWSREDVLLRAKRALAVGRTVHILTSESVKVLQGAEQLPFAEQLIRARGKLRWRHEWQADQLVLTGMALLPKQPPPVRISLGPSFAELNQSVREYARHWRTLVVFGLLAAWSAPYREGVGLAAGLLLLAAGEHSRRVVRLVTVSPNQWQRICLKVGTCLVDLAILAAAVDILLGASLTRTIQAAQLASVGVLLECLAIAGLAHWRTKEWEGGRVE